MCGVGSHGALVECRIPGSGSSVVVYARVRSAEDLGEPGQGDGEGVLGPEAHKSLAWDWPVFSTPEQLPGWADQPGVRLANPTRPGSWHRAGPVRTGAMGKSFRGGSSVRRSDADPQAVGIWIDEVNLSTPGLLVDITVRARAQGPQAPPARRAAPSPTSKAQHMTL